MCVGDQPLLVSGLYSLEPSVFSAEWVLIRG
jgi:hypothetical protein